MDSASTEITPVFDPEHVSFDKSVFRNEYLVDAVSILIKVLAGKFNENISVRHIFLYVKDYLFKYSELERYANDDETKQEQLQRVLKFFVKVLRSLNSSDVSKYISSKDFIQVFNLLPLSNKRAVNLFLNQVVPNIYASCDSSYKNVIIELLWSRIVTIFEKSSDVCQEPYIFSLLCCFAEYLTKEHCEVRNFNVQNNVLWKIIQTGLGCDSSFIRKQAIYVFKMLLFYLETKSNIVNLPCSETSLFHLHSVKNLIIWYDLILLFEVLEEKQIHVIKPVLPKFSRILQHASKCSPSDENSVFVHPSWITCLLRRMICHESKFIAKQGLSLAMDIDFSECQVLLLDSEKFVEMVVQGFNDQNMYCRLQETDCMSLFLSSEKILAFLTKCSAAFETGEQKVNFFRCLLKHIASESWCGVGILHLTFALTSLNSWPSWNSDDMNYLRKIQSYLKNHEPAVRTAVEDWLLKCCFLFIDWNSFSLENISEFLFIFKSLERHSEIWNEVVSKLKEIFTGGQFSNLSLQEVEIYCFNCIQRILTGSECLKETDLKKTAKLLMILADCSIISNVENVGLNWYSLLQSVTNVLSDAPKRPYMSENMFYNALQFYTHLIEASQGGYSRSNTDIHTCCIVKCLNCSVEFIEFICQKSFMVIKGSDDIIHFQVLYNALNVFSSLDIINELFIKILPSFIAKYGSIPDQYLTKKIVIILFYSVSASNFNEIKNKELILNLFSVLSNNLLKTIIYEGVLNDLSKSPFVNESEKELWLKLANKSVCDFWVVTSQVIQYLPFPDLQILTQAVVEQAQSIFDGGSKSTYASTINCIEILIPQLGIENVHIIDDLLKSAWKACEELHGSEAYRSAVNAFVQAVFQPFMLNENCVHILDKYIKHFQNLSENILGVYYHAVKQFCDVFSLKSLFQVKFKCIPFLIHALTYGPIHHKSQKILEDTIAYISDQDEQFATKFKNYNKSSIFVRVVLVAYLMKHLYKSDSESEKFSLQLMNNLLALDDSTKLSKSSKFANSYSHRIRNRIWQIMLLLQPNLVTRDEIEKVLKRILDSLESDNQQPSVRYLQEWFIMKLLNDHTCFIEYFLSVLKNSLEKSSGSLVSLLSVLTHLIMHDLITKNRASSCFPFLINYCMAQNFAVRLHSRLAIMKLFSFCEDKKITSLTEKYDFLHSILQYPLPGSILLEKGNVYKNLLKLQEDFYFSQFHPVRHFSLETIFYELPRLSNLPSEEWIKPVHFQDQLTSGVFAVPCFNDDDCLKTSISRGLSDKPVEELVENDSFDYNFQKKICPTRLDTVDCDTDPLCDKKHTKTDGLVVIASLVDKIPNLGGLCRTCEVFGVKEFVIGSLKYMEDKQFQNLAVSADRWISVKEVKPHNLKDYLLSLKEEGYTLVGAEQTDNSCKLTEYVFPEKSALLLGHEKEGMPVNLIQLLDACVEIPQQGVIRSLNVHVSGAIFIWEYARQQMKRP